MTRIFLMLALLAMSQPADAKDPTRRLTQAEHLHFDAVDVWMTPKQQRKWLHLKTPALREAWLKEHKLWDRYYQYDTLTRERIAKGEVRIGWTEDRVAMAWGKPADRLRPILPDLGQTTLLVYRFEVSPKGEVKVWIPQEASTHEAIRKFRIEVLLADGKVHSLQEKEGW